MRRISVLLLCLVASPAFAQEAPASSVRAANATIAGSAQTDKPTSTLDTIEVTAKRPDQADLYKFKNPVNVRPDVFDKDYREPPSLQEIGANGGVVPYAVGYLLGKLNDAAKSIPGWKTNQTVTARPPPLSDEQLQRAAKLQQQEASRAAESPRDTP